MLLAGCDRWIEGEREMGGEAVKSVGELQKIIDITRIAVERCDPPLLWAVDVAKCLHETGLEIPSLELGQTLVECVCGKCANPALLWSYLDQSMATHLVSSFHVLGLLTSRVVPNRLQYPEMYMMYIELTGTYAFSLGSTKSMQSCGRVIAAVDESLQLSLSSGIQVLKLGTSVVHFLFSLVWMLVDATSEDWGLPPSRFDKQSKVAGGASYGLQSQATQETPSEVEMELEGKQHEEREQMRRNNSLGAIELVAKILENKKTAALLRLSKKHLLDQWNVFAQRLQLLETLTHDASSTAPKVALEALRRLAGSMQRGLHQIWTPKQLPAVRILVETSSCTWSFGNSSGVGRAAGWLPFDILMEDAMDIRRVLSTSIVETLAETVKSLQAIQDASWHDTFLALFLSALRLVQREREPVEGPKPHIECRLCILLSVVPLAAAAVIEEEEKSLACRLPGQENSCVGTADEKEWASGIRRAALISSLQILGQFEGLLSPPQYAAVAAQQAAVAAGAFVAGVSGGNGNCEGMSTGDANAGNTAGGNLWHLLVEACIARGLIDTSAYFWPGYTGSSGSSMPHSVSSQSSPWSAFMDGAPLTGPLKNSLMATPAGSLAELEKVFQTAINGQEDERAAAASILCGASLLRGWNVQEHVVHLVVRLLCPPAPPDSKGYSHLMSYAPMLLAPLNGLISMDAVHILSLYGMFPELAAALMPICEVFGSISPAAPLTTSTGEDVSVLWLFSLAFLLLIRLWNFHRPPVEHLLLGMGAPLGSDRCPEYLLLRRNVQSTSSMGSPLDKISKDDQMSLKKVQSVGSSLPQGTKTSAQASCPSSAQPMTLDSFPKLKAWYLQHQACIASPLSGLVRGDPLHQVTDRLLTMMMRKMGKGGSVPTTPASVSSAGGDDAGGRPLLPAWDLLEAVPFVVDAVLTACGQGKLSPRDLITGLRDLLDLLPASLATIVSYFAAEVTRGLWKPASMNGTDWPNPAANLLTLEAEVRDMLAATGVNFPSTGSAYGNAPVTLPLPLAAFVSLTITYKGEKLSDTVLGVCGPALESAAGSSPWPSMPIVGALWAQKMRKWHDFIVFSSSQTIFKQDKNAVIQLLRSCFSVTLGSTSTSLSKLTTHGGVGALLGHGICSHAASAGRHPVAPGILYLRIYPALHDVMFVCEEILTLVVKAARDLASLGAEAEIVGASVKHGSRLRSVQPSLATTIARLTEAATLGASLLCVSGGKPLVQLLYSETLPTWFLSGGRTNEKPFFSKRGRCGLLDGFALARFALLSGAFVWGVSQSKEGQCGGAYSSFNGSRRYALHIHMEFLAGVLDGDIALGCEQATWKAYVVAFIGLVVSCAPSWILDVNVNTLRRLAIGLRMWHEYDLAVALLENGDPATINSAAEFILGC
eukprot:c24828_g1_i1 orf=179-4354(+)